MLSSNEVFKSISTVGVWTLVVSMLVSPFILDRKHGKGIKEWRRCVIESPKG